MKKFYLNILLFTIVMAGTLIIFDYLSMMEPTRTIIADLTGSSYYVSEKAASRVMKSYINKVQTQDGSTKLIIGDSVCGQMFNNLQECNDDFSIAASNAAVTMTSQYILAKEYLDNHPDATDIFLIVLPKSLKVKLGSTMGYQYAVMPFVRTGTIQDLDEDTIQIMESVYGKFFMKPSTVAAIDLSGMNLKLYLNFLEEYSSAYSFQKPYELADRYVYKIYEICQERNINFHLYPCPMPETNKEYVEGLKQEFEESLIYEINPEFLESIYYYPADEFTGSHFYADLSDRDYYVEKIKQVFEGEEIVEMLNFE